jgi:hypothetical protein
MTYAMLPEIWDEIMRKFGRSDAAAAIALWSTCHEMRRLRAVFMSACQFIECRGECPSDWTNSTHFHGVVRISSGSGLWYLYWYGTCVAAINVHGTDPSGLVYTAIYRYLSDDGTRGGHDDHDDHDHDSRDEHFPSIKYSREHGTTARELANFTSAEFEVAYSTRRIDNTGLEFWSTHSARLRDGRCVSCTSAGSPLDDARTRARIEDNFIIPPALWQRALAWYRGDM